MGHDQPGSEAERALGAVRRWEDAAHAVIEASTPDAERAALDRRSAERARLHSELTSGELPPEAFARRVLATLDLTSRRLFSETSIDESERARRLGLWRDEALWLKTALVVHLPGAPKRPFEDLVVDLHWLRARADGSLDLQSPFSTSWRQRTRDVEAHRDRVCLEHFEEAARGEAEEAFEALMLGWERFLVPGIPARDPDEEERLEAGRAACRERLRDSSVPVDLEQIPRWVEALDQRAVGLIADMAGQRPQTKAKTLEAVEREVELTGSALVSRARPEDRKSLSKKIRRRRRRLRNELQESRLQARLEKQFGVRRVAATERTILGLIFLVVVLLIVEASVDLSRTAELVLIAVDTGICFVFLAELAVRLYYVQGKVRYFARHALLDFVPAIPFGLLSLAPHLSALAGLDEARALRALRFLRVVRLARYVRAMRPLLRFVRLIAFLSRAADRMVERFAWLIDFEVILFERPQDAEPGTTSGIYEDLVRVQGRLSRGLRRAVEGLEPAERESVLILCLQGTPDRQILAAEMGAIHEERRTKARRRMGLEALIRRLVSADADQIEDLLGVDAVTRLDQILRGLDIPGLRLMPVIRRLVVRRRDLDPFERVALASQQVGRGLEEMQARVHWVADLWGVVTGPLLLDRIGSGLVRATQRPAIRLLLFGSLFLIANLTVELFSTDGESWLQGVMDWLKRTLGIPIIILGSICSVFYALGLWFKALAGEATDSCQKTAEAQFINLLKSEKVRRRHEDLAVLADRVLRPELLLRRRATDTVSLDVTELASLALEGRTLGHDAQLDDDARDWQDRELLLLLYRDFLDGAILHRSDTKATEQLLGNLTLEGIRRDVLHHSRKDRARLRSLDLERARSLFKGPYLWFNFLTQSIALKTARLLMEYNRHCLPLDERGTDPEQTRSFERWLAWRREGVGESYEPPVVGDEGFVTTEFTALHFLTVHPRRDEAVAHRFGPEVLAVLELDRRRMIRRIFGTWPMHRLPSKRRTFNAFESYKERLAGGRIVLLPLWILWFYLKVLVLAMIRLVSVVRDVLEQRTPPEEMDQASDFSVVLRKINRMRKPVFMECLRLRAAFDVEYLGCELDEQSAAQEQRFEADLDFIGALDIEREEIFQLQQTALDHLRGLEAYLRKHPLEEICPELPEGVSRAEQLRAVAIAHHVDHQGMRMALEGPERLVERFERVLVLPEKERPRPSLARRLALAFRPTGSGLMKSPKLDEAEFDRAWRQVARPEWGDAERAACQRAWQAAFGGLRLWVSQVGRERPSHERASDTLRAVALRPQSWSRRLLTLRVVQSLTVLDIQGYRDLVRELGGFESVRGQ
ncbi:MAG: ion transporter [Planctomycetota bacterium]